MGSNHFPSIIRIGIIINFNTLNESTYFYVHVLWTTHQFINKNTVCNSFNAFHPLQREAEKIIIRLHYKKDVSESDSSSSK